MRNISEIKSDIIKVLYSNGVLVSDVDMVDYQTDIDLSEYIEDSIQFITVIIELEKEFVVEWPDNLLLIDKFSSLENLASVIYELQTQNWSEA